MSRCSLNVGWVDEYNRFSALLFFEGVLMSGQDVRIEVATLKEQ